MPHGEDLPLPKYSTEDSAGADLFAAIDEPLVIEPHKFLAVSTGVKIALPEGFEAQVRPRSGLAFKHGITVLNSPGTIDADYRGEIAVALINHSDVPFTVNRGDRIAQLVISPVVVAEWSVAGSLTETDRGEGGFGHTGR